jgi:hypothetical protein
MFQELQIFAFVCTYWDAGCLFRLCGNDFGITPVDDITNGITWAVFCFHIAHTYFVRQFLVFVLFIGYCFGEIVYLLLLLLLLLFATTFMQCIYNCMPETNHVSRVYSAEAVMYLQFMLRVMLFSMLNMFCASTLALSAACVCVCVCVCVQCGFFLQFLNLVLSRYVAQVLSGLF